MAIRLKTVTVRRGGLNSGSRSGNGGRGRLLARDPIVRIGLLGFLSVAVVVVGVFAYWYVEYDRIIEERFRGPAFASSAKIFASPQVVRVGSKLPVSEIAAERRHAGYSEKHGESPLGSYRLQSGSIEGLPGPEAYHHPGPATTPDAGVAGS